MISLVDILYLLFILLILLGMHYIRAIIVILLDPLPIGSEITTILLLGLVNDLILVGHRKLVVIVEAIAVRLFISCCVLVIMDGHLLHSRIIYRLPRN